MAYLVKWIMVLGLMCAGALYLAHGIGIETPLAKYGEPGFGSVAVGLGIFAAGSALAAFWRIETNTAIFDRESSVDGSSLRRRKIIKVERLNKSE